MIDPLLDPGAFEGFLPDTTQWNPANAWALAQASELAYASDADIRQCLPLWGFPNFVLPPASQDDIRVVVAANADALLIVFRGTISEKDGKIDLNNWAVDADVWQVAFQDYYNVPGLGAIHRGFADALQEVWPQTLQAITQLRTNSQSLWVTGHSLGGALAHLATSVLTFALGEPVHGLYTYGQPRLGDITFCNQCDTSFGDFYYRVVNNQDIITRVPPRVLPHIPPEFYRHCGRLVYFDAQGGAHNDEHFWNDFLADVEVGFKNIPASFANPIVDHFLGNYLARLKGYIAGGCLPPLSW